MQGQCSVPPKKTSLSYLWICFSKTSWAQAGASLVKSRLALRKQSKPINQHLNFGLWQVFPFLLFEDPKIQYKSSLPTVSEHLTSKCWLRPLLDFDMLKSCAIVIRV